jgi:3-hydroxy-9,10-secoandrosta-1,3,5(10)-triene-9,17-dione monooxygenase reductase component
LYRLDQFQTNTPHQRSTVLFVSGTIHDEHPFLDPEDRRHPIRRFRGRLSAPVTIVTSGTPTDHTGLTVSSLMVAEGEPPRVHFLLGDQSYLWDRIRQYGTFTVHVLEHQHRKLSSRFAGIDPSPGGPFKGIETTPSDHGPVIAGIGTRASCRFETHREGDGAYVVVDGIIEDVVVHDLTDPLQWFRGSYRRLAE